MTTDHLMQVLLRTKVLIIVGVLVVVAAASWVFHARAAFVTKCWNNGNGLVACNCTFDALPELPTSYRSLAESWAHESGTAFAGGVMLLVANEMGRIVNRHIDLLARDKREKAVGGWIDRISKAIGWGALIKASPKVAPVIVAVVVMGDATREAAAAQQVMRNHCGSGWSFMVRVEETYKAAAGLVSTLSSPMIDAAADAGAAAAEKSGNAISKAWEWVKSWFWSNEPEEKK